MDKELYHFYNKFTKDVNKQVKEWLEQYEKLSFSKKIELERLLNIDNEVRKLLEKPAIDIGRTIKDRIVTEGNAGYNSVYYSLETGHNIDLDFHFLDKKYLETLSNNKVAGKTLSQRLYKQRTQLAQRTTDAIARGMMFGYGYDRMALEIRTVSEASYNQAVRIARTESGRVRSIATQRAYLEAKNKGVYLQKQWMSTSDSRTREDHSILNGQVVDVEEDFVIGNYKAQGPRMFGVGREDINCRCTTVSVVNGIAPELVQDGENFYQKNYDNWLEEHNFNVLEHKALKESSKKWFDSLSEQEQKAIQKYTSDTGWYISKSGKDLDFLEYFSTTEEVENINFNDLNRLLRKGEVSKIVGLSNIIKDLDSAIDKFSIDRNIKVFRNSSKAWLESVHDNSSYVSASIYKQGLDKFGAYEIEILLPKGSAGAYVGNFSDNKDESELLIGRKTKFKIIDRDDEAKKATIQVVK